MKPGVRPGRAEEVLVLQGHDAQQRAFAGAVAADDADLGAGIERQPDVLEHLALAVGLGEVLDREDVLFGHANASIGKDSRIYFSLVFRARSVKGHVGANRRFLDGLLNCPNQPV